MNSQQLNMQTIHAGPILDADSWSLIDLSFSSAKIKEVIWLIADNKADGFKIKFYKVVWPIVSHDVLNAI